ncbi:unnamed protein product [Chilo suppressalis]|uniref:Zasp-like motif domain-containing protein n=1 Tax=Chilo suppressalis TaxID=168631 RepID=A0ABN8ARI4_CHISP|nr:unnamed protein product [Chilo suppressalis]
MVRITAVLARVPMIKFRKGGAEGSGAGPMTSPKPTQSAAQPQPQQSQSAAAMSTGVISDIDLPARYRRQPMSQEEIDHINGGGIRDPTKLPGTKPPSALAVIRVPRGVLVETGKKEKHVMCLNIVLQKTRI